MRVGRIEERALIGAAKQHPALEGAVEPKVAGLVILGHNDVVIDAVGLEQYPHPAGAGDGLYHRR